MTIIILTVWLIGSITAYPRNKKWCLANLEQKEWTNGDMLQAIIASLCMWYFIWAWYLFEKISDMDFLYKKSKF